MSDATQSAKETEEYRVGSKEKTFLRAMAGLTWRISKWVGLAIIGIVVPAFFFAEANSAFGMQEAPDSAFGFYWKGVASLALPLAFIYGTRWVLMHRPMKGRLSTRKDT